MNDCERKRQLSYSLVDLGVSRSSRDGGTILPNKQRLSGTDARARARRQLDLLGPPPKSKRNRVVTRGLQVREKANLLIRQKSGAVCHFLAML